MLQIAVAQVPEPNLATLSGDCETTAQKFAVGTKEILSRPGRQFVNIPEKIQFEQGGTEPGCVIVSVSAESQADAGAAVQIRPLLDLHTHAMPITAQFVAANWAGYNSQAMTFVFARVSPGAHTLHLQYASISTTAVRLRARSIVVNYYK